MDVILKFETKDIEHKEFLKYDKGEVVELVKTLGKSAEDFLLSIKIGKNILNQKKEFDETFTVKDFCDLRYRGEKNGKMLKNRYYSKKV